ncbi:hypothetical protein CFC21_097223 [Triticum aestivum]|uniref:Uncharacterized protein n=2 Tax=Triticum aestivum TaxID=4565 RepID=A0A9R1LU17_WHEAT|nr:hypothetical protein CFC21_097223 [Triticum aestivum]
MARAWILVRQFGICPGKTRPITAVSLDGAATLCLDALLPPQRLPAKALPPALPPHHSRPRSSLRPPSLEKPCTPPFLLSEHTSVSLEQSTQQMRAAIIDSPCVSL